MKLNEIPLIGGFYKDEDRDWSVQDCVNYLPTVAETTGTRTQTMLRTAPGLRPFVRVPGAGPCRGVYNCEGRLFAVLGDMLYLVGADQIAVPIGKIPGIQKVQFSHNQATSSGQNQLVIGNGQAGYVYNTNTKEFKRITDEGFIGGISPTFVDSYIVWVSTNRLYMLNSSVADATEYNTLDQFQSEYSPDKLVCTIASSSELVAMSERSIEFFQNVGANEQPFRSKGISIDLGAASRWGAVICDFSLFFLASDGTFRRIDNYNATRISTGPVEQAIRDLDWTQAQAYVWEEGRYKVVYWTFPDGYTFGWDIANGMWHRRVSYGLNRWRVSSTARWNGKTIAGDFQRGDLWIVDSNYFLEGDQEYNCEITGPYIHGDGNLVKMPRMDLIMQTGQEETKAQEFPEQPPTPRITNEAPSGDVGFNYPEFTYAVESGTPPFVFSVREGEIPPGIGGLTAAGVIPGGTPTSAGDYRPTIRVTDSNGMWDEIIDSISIGVPWYAVGSLGSTGRGRYAIGRGGGSDWDFPVQLTGVGFADEYGLVISRGAQLVMVPPSSESAAVSVNGGVSWATAALPVTNSRVSWAIDNDTILIGCNDSVIMRSVDGLSYSAVTVDTSGSGSFYGNFNAICSNGSRSIAVGDRASISTDKGISWSALGVNYVVANGVVMRCMATNGSIFIAAGDSNRLAKSATGSAWTEISSPFLSTSSQISVAAFANNIWVIANQDGRIAFGPNIDDMNISPFDLGEAATALYGNMGRFVIGTQSGAMYLSSNGATWETLENPFTSAVSNIASDPGGE